MYICLYIQVLIIILYMYICLYVYTYICIYIQVLIIIVHPSLLAFQELNQVGWMHHNPEIYNKKIMIGSN